MDLYGQALRGRPSYLRAYALLDERGAATEAAHTGPSDQNARDSFITTALPKRDAKQSSSDNIPAG